MADKLSNLPIDSSIPNHKDIQTVNEIFKKHKSSMDNVANEFKIPFLYGVLFIFLSLPFINSILSSSLPSLVSTNSEKSNNLMLLVIKGFIFMLLVFCIQNFLNTQNS